MGWLRKALRNRLAFAIGVAASAVTVAVSTFGSGFAFQMADRLNDGVSRQQIFNVLQQTFGADASWQFVAQDARHGSLARWSDLGVSLSKIWTGTRGTTLDVKGAARGPLASMVNLPVAIDNADRLDRHTVLLVRNVPEYSALSVGRPLGAGAWVVPADFIRGLGIISYAQPSRRPLILDLVTSDGMVVSSAEVLVEIT